MNLKKIFTGRLLMSLTAMFLFVHFTAILTLLMLRVLQLDDANFVNSLEAVGGFFRDSSMAAFLVTLMRHNFPKQALRSIQAAVETRGQNNNNNAGGWYPPMMGGYQPQSPTQSAQDDPNDHPWDDIDYGDRVAAF